jgi:hypothetical protein
VRPHPNLETVTDWVPERRLRFTIAAQTDSIPASTLDEHVTIGGPYFDVLSGRYDIRAAPNGGVVLDLTSELRVSTHFNAKRSAFHPQWRSPMLRAYGFTLSLALGTLSPNLAIGQAPAELQDAMRQRSQAVVSADAATWDRLTADDFTVVLANGTMLTKEQRLALLKKEKPRRQAAIQQEQIKHYGDTYVRRFLGDRGWVLEVWTKDDAGKWRVSAVQVTPAAKK